MSKPTRPDELDAVAWDACNDVDLFAAFLFDTNLWGRPPFRKLRLVAAAALRAVWKHIPDPASRAAVEAAEEHCFRPDAARLSAACDAATTARIDASISVRHYPEKLEYVTVRLAIAAEITCEPDPFAVDEAESPLWVDALRYVQSDRIPGQTAASAEALHLALFRDIVPNPFDPVSIEPAWRTSDVVGLCEAMVAANDFSAMPVLADALQDAGCDDERVLGHCRGGGVHARGCWVVDALLGFEAFPDAGSPPS